MLSDLTIRSIARAFHNRAELYVLNEDKPKLTYIARVISDDSINPRVGFDLLANVFHTSQMPHSESSCRDIMAMLDEDAHDK